MCESSTWPAQCVLFAERTAQVKDGQSTLFCSRGEPLRVRSVLLGMRRVTSWLHVWLESCRRVNPCRMVPSTRDEVRGQLHDITSKVQSARAASCHAGAARNWKKKNREQKQASLSGEQDSQVRGERPPVWGTGYH